MSRYCVLVLACTCGLALSAAPVFADDPKPAPKKADPVEEILGRLAREVQFKEGANVNEIPMFELVQDLSKRYDLTFVLNVEAFRAVGQQNFGEEKPRLAATNLRGLTLHQFLSITLDSLGAVYLVKNNAIEIVPVQHAAKLAKTGVTQEEDGRARLNEPLVSAVFKEKPLNEAVAKVAEMYDLTVAVLPQAGDARTGFVTARLLNMPADKALELLALQADLRVVRRGAAYLVTSKDHANELFNEKLEKERQLIELQKFREAKPPTLGGPPAPEKPPEKAPEKPPILLDLVFPKENLIPPPKPLGK